MDDDAMQQTLDIRDFEIERRFDAFARARLSPDPAATARARARVMREARLQFEAARIAAHVAPAVALAGRRSSPRRFLTPLLAASMWVGIAVGSVAAAQAGGPLYPTRMWLEGATLPANAADRTAAELARLDSRLGDALSAAARGDANAVAAALAAYRQIADETITASIGDEALEALVSAALDRHVAALTAVAASLEAKGNTTAAAAVETAIDRAIEHNAAVVAGLAANGTGKPEDGDQTHAGGAGSGSTGGDSDAATGGTGGNAGGNGGAVGADNGQTGNGQTGEPKPSRPPKPTPPAHSAPPDAPDHTPRGQSQ
jgi:hypothetical protein